MSIQQIILKNVGRTLLGSLVFQQITDAVQALMSSTLSGQEKKSKVVDDLQHIVLEIGESLVNLGVELAYQWLKKSLK